MSTDRFRADPPPAGPDGGSARLPTRYGEFRARVHTDPGGGSQHLLLTLGDAGAGPVLVRLHSECLTGDTLGSLRCDCGAQLDLALRLIAGEARGVLLYLRQEGRGIGLHDKMRAYALQDEGLDTVEANERLGHPADAREYGVAAEMLAAAGVAEVRLLTNNPGKVDALEARGVRVVERVPLLVPPTPENGSYLDAKRRKLGHLLG